MHGIGDDGAVGLNGVNLRQLEVFDAIMRSGSVTAAARELGMTQSAISRILARFESEIGFQLFSRANGRLTPTPRANAVLVQVREALVSLSGLRMFQAESGAASRNRLDFVTVPSLAQALVPSVLRAFLDKHPDMRIGFDVRSTEATLDVMTRRQAAFAIVAQPVSHPALKVTALFRSASYCVLHRDHPLARKRRISAGDLKGEPLIFHLGRQPIRQLIEETFLRAGVLPEIRVETSIVATACRCARERLGIAVVNGLMAGYAADPELAVLPFEPRIHHTLALIEPAGQPRPAVVSDFIDSLTADINATALRLGVAVEQLAQTHSNLEYPQSQVK